MDLLLVVYNYTKETVLGAYFWTWLGFVTAIMLLLQIPTSLPSGYPTILPVQLTSFLKGSVNVNCLKYDR